MKLNQKHLSIGIALLAATIFILIGLSVWPAEVDSDTALKNCLCGGMKCEY